MTSLVCCICASPLIRTTPKKLRGNVPPFIMDVYKHLEREGQHVRNSAKMLKFFHAESKYGLRWTRPLAISRVFVHREHRHENVLRSEENSTFVVREASFHVPSTQQTRQIIGHYIRVRKWPGMYSPTALIERGQFNRTRANFSVVFASVLFAIQFGRPSKLIQGFIVQFRAWDVRDGTDRIFGCGASL